MKSRIITIAGTLGSGKSSTGKRIAAELGYRHFSSGDFFREIAKEHGVTVEEINKKAELEKEIDFKTDEKVRSLASENDLIIDSRMAFHWIPSSFKVFLTLPPEAAAKRIFTHMQQEGRISESAESPEEVLRSIQSRRESERKRYADLYQIDIDDTSPYDLIVDTEKNDLNAVVRIIVERYRTWVAE